MCSFAVMTVKQDGKISLMTLIPSICLFFKRPNNDGKNHLFHKELVAGIGSVLGIGQCTKNRNRNRYREGKNGIGTSLTY